MTAFAELSAACAALGLDPQAGTLHLTPAAAPHLDAASATLIAGAGPADAASLRDLLSRRYPGDHRLRVAQADASVIDTTVAGLKAGDIAPGAVIHVAALAAEADVRDFRGLVAIIRRLRDPVEGCPWDNAQTHESLKSHLIEEAYETLQALDEGDPAALREELGDLLLQIVLHARIAEQAGEFETADIIEGLSAKLVRRHPHVFAGTLADTPEEVERNWEELKRREKAASGDDASSALGGVPIAMPALAYSHAILGRAERAGFAWPATSDVLAKVAEEAAELAAANDAASAFEEMGDLLFALVSLARRLDIDAEEAARRAAAKFAGRFRAVEAMSREQGVELRRLPAEALLALWAEAKRWQPPSTLPGRERAR